MANIIYSFKALSPPEMHALDGAYFRWYKEAEIGSHRSSQGVGLGEMELLETDHSLHDPDKVGTAMEYVTNLALAAQLRNLTEGEQ